ncbi:MAG TPA: heparan-alpha-glucosaminide N-acetyltransferase domain-containing protein, partial [Thermoanaerobaculia bacterium]|nr:heparan-alpha-glucosaminide N-acetyltransferase domain-containing protein [Thermoanaerobaculia bacterium]
MSAANRRPPTANRIEALDAMRGFTVAGMLLVNNPGTWSAIYWPLRHAEWHGWTPTDLIFPFFLFIVGITTELSRKEPLGILRRGALIIACGLLLNLFPYFRFETLRWMGVLQRIGIVYIVAALISLKASRRTIVLIAAAILVGYWLVLTRGPLAPPEATIAAQVDRALIPAAHLWKQSRTWDPEGPLSTIPAVATALLGIAAAPWVRAKNVKMLIIAGVIGVVAGLAWGELFPINKNLWTSSYVVFTAGAACLVLALWMRWLPAKPFVVFGVNPLIAFLGSGMMARVLGITKVQPWSYRTFFQPYFEPHLASLLWALTFVL